MNIALISPSKNAYSETFIRAHKELLEGNIYFYYSGELPTEIEDGLLINSRRKRIIDIIKGHFHLNRYTLDEQALIDSFKNNNIDLVFAEYGGTGERMIPVCEALGLPLIVHFHGFDATRSDQLQINRQYKGIFKYASYIVCVSKKMEQDLLLLGCPREKLIYNVYGPRDEFFEVEPRYSKQQFIALGRFVDKKAPYYLILSFLKLVEKYPDLKLVIAGDGPLWNTCKNLIWHYGLDKNIELPGVIGSEQFRDYLSESLAFIQHSITSHDGDAEGTPVAILEASAAGLPVISTLHAGVPDVIINNETGFLVKEHDVKGMAEKMEKLLLDTSEVVRLGTNGRKNIGENYTLKRHMEVLNELTKKAINC